MKNVDLALKYEELYDMSNKKYSDSVWEEKLTVEELKMSGKLQGFFIAHFEGTIILLSQKF
jgi:hypothetical protein